VRGSFSNLSASCCSRCHSACSSISSIYMTRELNTQSLIFQ
jgi:hypothetical protein